MAIEISTVDYTVKAEVYEEYGADFDIEAVNDAVLAELNGMLPAGITVHRNGMLWAEPHVEQTARDLDFDSLLKRIDIEQILAVHGK